MLTYEDHVYLDRSVDRSIDQRIGGTTRPVDIDGWELILRAHRHADGYAPEVLPAPFYGQDAAGFEHLLGCPLTDLYDPEARYADPAECLGELEAQIRVGLHRFRGTKRLRLHTV